MDRGKYRRWGWAIYLLIFALAVILGFLGVFVFKSGSLHDLLLNLAAGLGEVAIIFFIVQQFFLYSPEDERGEQLVRQYEDLAQAYDRIADALKYTDVQSRPDEAFEELIDAYRSSNNSIEVISWQDIGAQLSEEGAQEYRLAAEQRLKRTPTISFRWVLWKEDHLETARYLVEGEGHLAGAEIGFYLPPSSISPAVIPCAIVDSRMVNFGWGYLGQTQMDQVNITLRHPEAVQAFADYFGCVWRDCVIIKKPGETVLEADKVAYVQEFLSGMRETSVQVSQDDAYEELKKAYGSSTQSIDIISWRELRVSPADTYKQSYFEALNEHVRSHPAIKYRRLLWRRQHLVFIEEQAAFLNSVPNLEITFFLPREDRETPIMPCVIVDSDTVNFGWGYLGRPQLDEVNITLKQPEAVGAFRDYFSYLWQSGVQVKRRNEVIDEEALARIRESINSKDIIP